MRQLYNDNYFIKTVVFILDFILLNLLLYAYICSTKNFIPHIFIDKTKAAFLIANLAMVTSMYFFPTVLAQRNISFFKVLIRTLRYGITQVVITFLIIRFMYGSGELFRFMIISGCTLIVALIIERFGLYTAIVYIRKTSHNKDNIIFIGNDNALLQLYNDLQESNFVKPNILGYFGDQDIKDCPESLKRVGTIEQLNQKMDKVLEHGFSTPLDKNTYPPLPEYIFCSLSHNDSDEIIKIINFCDTRNIRFFYVPRSFGDYKIQLKPVVYGSSLTYGNHMEPLSLKSNKIEKRIFDIIISSLALLCILPFLPIIALIIKIQSPGPIFFRQARTGLNGKTFTCYKFRSMHINKDADTAQATKDDPRKFPFGQFMRRTNIDELPQFFNVLKGDMSIVGPRPHMLYHTDTYSKIIEKYMVRHFCKPGITGYAQVTGYRGETKELWQMEERIHRDIWYIENWSLWLDIKIIFITAWSILVPNKNAY